MASNDIKSTHDNNPTGCDDVASDYYYQVVKDADGALSDEGMSVTQMRAVLEIDPGIEGRLTALEVGDPPPIPGDPSWSIAAFPDNLLASVSAINITDSYWIIQKDNETTPTGSGTLGTVPSTYPIDTVWTADTLQPHTFSLFTSNDDSTYTQVGSTLTITATSTAPVDQTPNDVVYIEQTGVATSTSIDSNAVAITGLLAPTAITIADGSYSINGGAYTTAAGVIDENDSVRLRQTSSGSNNTETTTTVQLGLREETWDITTVAVATTHGEISIDSGPYEEDEDAGTMTFTLTRTGGSDGEVTVRVSTYYSSGYHTAEPSINYTAIVNQLVTFADTDISETVNLTLVDSDNIYNNVGEFQIDWASATGGATIDTDNDAVLFTINGTGSVTEDSWQQSATGDHIVKIPAESSNNVLTARNGYTWASTTYKSLACLESGTGWARNGPGFSTASPDFMAKINFSETGTHYLHAKVSGLYSTPNFDVGLDGGEQGSTFSWATYTDWIWIEDSSAYSINIADTGIHELRIYMADEYTYVTDIILTDNASYDSPTDGDGESTSTWTSGGTTGDNPNNPSTPLGPGPIVDDRTPDIWVFQSITGVSTTPGVYTTATKTLSGVNVPTDISITGDGSPQYQIGGGAWGNAAGIITNTQTFAVRLTSSATNGVERVATLTIGTVSVDFSVTTVGSGAVVLTPKTTTTYVTANSTTIEDTDFVVAGPCVSIAAGVTGTVITNCRMKAGSSSHAITGANIGTLDIDHVEILEAGRRGVYVYGSTGVSVTDCVIENCSASVSIWETDQNITVEDNYLKNVDGQKESFTGNCVQLAYCKGANFSVQNNIMINEQGQSYAEDIINTYESRGASSSYMVISGNKIRGGGPSNSAGAIASGDFDTSSPTSTAYFLIENNVIYKTCQTGIGAGNGDYSIVRGNKIFSVVDSTRTWPNLGLNIAFTRCDKYPSDSPVGVIVENNKIHFWQSPTWTGSGWSLQPYYVAPCAPTPAGWSTNLFDTNSNPNASGLTDEEAAGTLWDTDWDIRPDVLTTP